MAACVFVLLVRVQLVVWYHSWNYDTMSTSKLDLAMYPFTGLVYFILLDQWSAKALSNHPWVHVDICSNCSPVEPDTCKARKLKKRDVYYNLSTIDDVFGQYIYIVQNCPYFFVSNLKRIDHDDNHDKIEVRGHKLTYQIRTTWLYRVKQTPSWLSSDAACIRMQRADFYYVVWGAEGGLVMRRYSLK